MCTDSFEDEKGEIIQCEYCFDYFCNKCLKIPTAQYDMLMLPSIHWFCPLCEEKVMRNLRTDREVEERCEEFLKKFEKRIENLETKMQTVVTRAEVNDIVRDAIQGESRDTLPNSDVIQEAVNKKVSEFRESSTREKNIIIYGVQELESTDSVERKQADTEFVEEICSILEGESDSIKNVVRIGKWAATSESDNEKKPRPMKVCLNSVDSKKKLMKNLSKLKHAPEKFRKVNIADDMTREERLLYKAKVQEAKEKNEVETGNFRHVVRGPPWARRVVRVVQVQAEAK